MDEEAADAMMESMPPVHWDHLATKDDIARVDDQLQNLDARLDTVTLRVDQNSSDLQALTRTVAEQGTTLGLRIDGLTDRVDTLGQRMDGFGHRMDGLTTEMATVGRAITIGAATIAATLAVFMIGTIASLIAAGAFS